MAEELYGDDVLAVGVNDDVLTVVVNNNEGVNYDYVLAVEVNNEMLLGGNKEVLAEGVANDVCAVRMNEEVH